MKKPNFLIFMTDHQRGDTVLKDSKILTPNIDRFRAKSVTFTDAYCPAPHCCPSRATFFSGLYPSQHGVWNNVQVDNTLSRGLFDGTKLFSEDLKENGYDLYFSGKWHVSSVESPADKGFELIHHRAKYRKVENKNQCGEWNSYINATTRAKDSPRSEGEIIRPGYPEYTQYGINENPFGDADVVEAAVQKIHALKNTDTPFALYAGTLGPHDPYVVPQRFLDMYNIEDIELPASFSDTMEDKPALYRRTRERYSQLTDAEHKESIRHFYAFCTYEDYLFGQLLDALDETALSEDTVVMYCSDHGDYIGSHGLWAKGLPCFKEAYHVCSIIGGYGIHNPGRECSAIINLADFAPTILEMAGIEANRDFIGASLVPFLNDENPRDWRTVGYTQSNGNEVYGIQRSVYTKKWKYVFNTFDYDELYDLENDPCEMKNLLHNNDQTYKDIVKEMCQKMWQFAYDANDNCVNPYIMTAMAPYGPGIIFNK